MIDHFTLAVNGITPNCNHFLVANFGTFSIEVITNIVTGGSGLLIPIYKDTGNYEIVVNIKFKDKVWTIRKFFYQIEFDSFINIIVNFDKIRTISYIVKTKFMQLLNSIPEFLIKKKSK